MKTRLKSLDAKKSRGKGNEANSWGWQGSKTCETWFLIFDKLRNSGGQSIPTFSDRLPDLGSYSPITYKILQKVSDRYEEFSSCPSKPPFWGKNENFSIFCPKRSFMLKDTNMIKQVITIGTKLSF